MITWLGVDDPFPAVERAWGADSDAPGLLAAGGVLSPQRLLQAYQQGIFPWFSEGQPVLWWSTDPRMVLRPEAFKISASLKKSLKKIEKNENGRWALRFDSAFAEVMQACAAPRKSGHGTWILPEIVAGYCGLHALGYAHSIELWLDDQLVAGAYGVCIGRMFFGESMFTKISDGSKIALSFLVDFLQKHDVKMIDCQQQTNHLASLGATPIARAQFLDHLKQAIQAAPISVWPSNLLD